MAKVTVDVTGFYFEQTVDVQPKTSVLEVMRAVEAASGAGNTPLFRFVSSGDGSIRTISVEHRIPPVSRQGVGKKHTPFPKNLDAGFYEFTEQAPDAKNQVIAWQYYVMKPVAGSPIDFTTVSADRKIETASKGIFDWTDGMKIVWRGVLICLNRTIDFGKGGVPYKP
jgi:hypothetical protein